MKVADAPPPTQPERNKEPLHDISPRRFNTKSANASCLGADPHSVLESSGHASPHTPEFAVYRIPNAALGRVMDYYPTLVISASFPISMAMESSELLVDQVLNEYDDDDVDLFPVAPSQSTASASAAVSPTTPSLALLSSTTIQAKRIRPELDPLPFAACEERTEYFTVSDYVWPSPAKRACHRMPDEQRRQRHRESQREFMTRKRAQFREMRSEIRGLERQLECLQADKELSKLAAEKHTLETALSSAQASIYQRVWTSRVDSE